MRRFKKYELNHQPNLENSICEKSIYNNNHNHHDQQNSYSKSIGNSFAVTVDSVAFSYKKNIPLLQDVSINVPKGKIYSLLGSNGCGKTTLLNILLGRIQPQKGTLSILGHRPGPKLNHLIGYMPQELGLNPLLHIEDTFYYFAQVNHIKDMELIKEQIRKYLEMLDLNDPKKKVGELSGGQKRLLSLGVTLIYKPRILLLDEPTVGIDSLIRSKIWTHLRQLCLLNQTTVIITTHYIDEAKQSDLVGFLHEGQLLAEESPNILMQYMGCKTLEQVFLKLCHDHNNHSFIPSSNLHNNSSSNRRHSNTIVAKDFNYFRFNKNNINNGNIQNGIKSTTTTATVIYNHQNYQQDDLNNNDSSFPNQYADKYPITIPNDDDNIKNNSKILMTTKDLIIQQHNQDHTNNDNQEIYYKNCAHHYLNIDHLYALMCREWFFFSRNLIIFLVYLLMPLLTIYLFDSSYGRTPRNVPIAIFNGDQSDFDPHLSDVFLEEFNTSMVRMSFYPTEDDAIRSVELGKNVIAITFRGNFSKALVERYYDFHSFDMHKKDDTAVDSSMHLYIDHSSLLNVRYVNRSILLAFQRTIEKFGTTRGINPQIFSLPIDKKEYVYGVLEPHFQDLFTPGIIIITLLAMNTIKSSFEIIYLHQNGCLKRDINQGIRPFEMLFTFTTASMASIFWQTLTTMVFTFFIMNVQLDGDFTAAFILVFITACQGLFIGTFLSVLFPDQIISMLLCFTALVVMFFTSGTLWPIEGMSLRLQQLFMLNPIVLPVRSLRFIMLRGWSVYKFSVFVGYLVSSGFCIVLFIISSFFFHYLNIRIK